MEKINSVYFATSNKGKLQELITIFKELYPGIERVYGRAPKDCEETAKDFLGNARIKAECLSQQLIYERAANERTWVISDDSGLCVDCLGGQPGIHSARYAGDHVQPSLHIEKLLLEIRKTGAARPWSAHYHCALVLQELDQNRLIREYSGEGQCHGEIVETAQGTSGFGYDPIFLFSKSGLRFSEIAEKEKNDLSHRMAAFLSLKRNQESRSNEML